MRYSPRLTLLILAAIAFGVTALAACASNPLAPAAAVSPSAAATVAETPSLAPLPTATSAPRPSPSTTPSPTASLTPSSTSTSTPSPTVTATPGPTLPPGALLTAAQRYQTNGDYERAIAAYLEILSAEPTPDEARQVQYHLAESYLLNSEFAAAAAAWEQFLTSYPDDPRVPEAHLMAGRAYQADNECPQAVSHFEAYTSRQPVLGDMVYEWIGDCYALDTELEQAIAAYQKGLDLSSDRSTRAGLLEKIAGAHLALGQYDTAVSTYDTILLTARTPSYRARIEYLAGQAQAAGGQTEAAHTRYRRVVDEYPSSESAYLSLIELVNADVPVDEFQRGLVDFYAGEGYPDAYGAAIGAFDRYLDAKPAPKADEALYRKALSLRALEQMQDALDTLEVVILDHPKSSWLSSAWFEEAVTLAAMGENERAVKVYQDMSAFFPADKLAPRALWNAAKLREGEGAYSKAAQLYEDLQANFPAYEDAAEALWRAGLAHYRAGAPDKAAADWQVLPTKYPKSSFGHTALYWLGKLEAQKKVAAQGRYWDQLLKLDAHGYYSLRVRQTRSREPLSVDRLVVDAIAPPAWDARQAEAEILGWMQGWTEVPTGTRLVELPAALTGRQDFQRGTTLLAVGLRREALAAFDGVRAAVWSDPVGLAQLSFSFYEQGLYGLSARCAARLVGLWPGGFVQDAPLPVKRLAYPLAYADLLSANAQEEDLDPLLLAAVIRQESLFEPVAESYAGARGLGQVMPATGEGIAQSLDMTDFELDDLYWPWVSIRFAAFYLGVQLERFDGQILVALAAYNGGPGNTLRWLEAAPDDLDLFVEVITASQSRRYLQEVYEQYLTYENIYR